MLSTIGLNFNPLSTTNGTDISSSLINFSHLSAPTSPAHIKAVRLSLVVWNLNLLILELVKLVDILYGVPVPAKKLSEPAS